MDKVYSRGKALISEYKRKISEVVLISATIKNLVEPVGLYLGFPRENILAINILEENNRIKGETKDTLTFKEGKVERLLEWANNRNITTNNITFYSDSVNDLPLLEYAKTAIATNPSKDLYQIAKLRGWQIIEFEHYIT
ncbi:HAD family hydrolase [Francisella halioticida]|uniref:HAD family hydrolase n=1 Tax=Francisella halioticida TaxID=549298 RepID=UPI002100E230|nr:haloacid dehalogenase-like hydrolase [Francisella halioticida]